MDGEIGIKSKLRRQRAQQTGSNSQTPPFKPHRAAEQQGHKELQSHCSHTQISKSPPPMLLL